LELVCPAKRGNSEHFIENCIAFMSGLYLDDKQFTESFLLVPRVAIDVLILNKSNQFLLTRRGIEPELGKWHIPGGFLLKGESIVERIERIGVEELGFTISANDCRLAQVSDNLDADPRGHIVDIVYKCRVLRDILLKPWGDSVELGFFNNIPKDIGFNHAQILSKWYN